MKTKSNRSIPTEKNVKYDTKIEEIRHMLLNAGLGEYKTGEYCVDIILIAAMVNMHIPRKRIQIMLGEMRKEELDEDYFQDAITNLKSMDIIWHCSDCKGIDCRAKKYDYDDFCLRDINNVVSSLENRGYKFGNQKEKLLNDLEAISSHGLTSCREFRETWKLVEDGLFDLPPFLKEFNKMFTVVHFDELEDVKLQKKTISILTTASKNIKIISTYGQWLAKKEFKVILGDKIKKGVLVKLIVDKPPATGTNCRLEWEKWHSVHREMGIKPLECWLNFKGNRNTCINMTIVDDTKAIFFMRNLYGLKLKGARYTDYPPYIEIFNKIFKEYEKTTRLTYRIKIYFQSIFKKHKTDIGTAIVGAIVGYFLGGLIGIILGILAGYFAFEPLHKVLKRIYYKLKIYYHNDN